MTATLVTVRRVRHGPPWAAAAGRNILQRWLSGIDLTRHGLQPQAVVIVRRLQAPAAALQTAAGTRQVAPGRCDPLAEVLRGAVRPAAEAARGAGAAAVWFADEAELLVCLARDALGSELAVRWWWPLLWGNAPTLALAVQRWAAAPQAVPWALAALAAGGHGAAWLQHIGLAGRQALVQALARVYPVCEAVAGSVLAPARAAGLAAARGAAPPSGHFEQTEQAGRPSGWRARGDDSALPNDADDLDAVQALLRLAEVLRQTPHRAASADLVAELWARAGSLPSPTAMPGDSAAGATPALSTEGATTARPGQADHAAARGRGGVLGLPTAAADGRLPSGALRADAPRVRPAPWRLAGPPVSLAVSSPGWPPAAPAGAHPLQQGAQQACSAATESPARPPLPAAGWHTQFGGVAFLLNVALHLGLYGDFTQPQQRGLAMSPWHLLHTALGRAVGRRGREDPLAFWLRTRGSAHGPRLCGVWQVPAAALRAFDGDLRPWHARSGGGRWQLWHPAGFCVAHQPPAVGLPAVLAALQRPQQAVVWHGPGEGRAATSATAAIAAIAATSATSATAATATAPAPRLSTLVCALLRARLALALGLPGRAALALVVALPARVQVHSERLDLHFSLCALPLAVRLAGLDRDPGWLPAAGCDIRFHFD